MGHSGAADGLNQSFLNDAVLDVQRQLAGTLLRSAPADAVCVAGDVLDISGLHPFRLFRDRSCAMVYALVYDAHVLYFL